MNRSINYTIALFLIICLGAGRPARSQEVKGVDQSAENQGKIELLRKYILYPGSCVGFQDRGVPSDTLEAVLEAVTPYLSLSEWRLVVVCERENRIGLFTEMQNAYRKLGKERTAGIMERWKPAPVVLAFCMPGTPTDFGGVPGELMRPMSFIELGMGVQSLILTARAHGIETHWIASALMINDTVKKSLGITEGYDIAFFGVAGYPSEEIDQEFPPLRDVCFKEYWGNPADD